MDYKSLTTEELDSIFQDYNFKTKPLHHQAVSLAWSQEHSRLAYWHDIGVGKSLTSLYTIKLWGAKKTLIIHPSAVRSWTEQISKHTNQSCINLQGTAKVRKEKIKQKADLYLINYEGLRVLFWMDSGKTKINKKGKPEAIMCVDKDAIKHAGFDSVIVDEAHHTSNRDAIQTQIAHELSMQAKYAIIMTGSPISTDEMNLWAEYWVLDGGICLGTNFYKFRSAHFNNFELKLKSGRKFFKWYITKSGKEAILEKVAAKTLRYSREECFDLPKKVYQSRYVDANIEQRKLMKGLIDGIQIELESGVLKQQDLLHRAGKLSQVVGGFLLLEDGGVQRTKKNPKLAELDAVLDEVEGKVVIFHEYVEEGRMIEELMKRKKLKFASLRGEIKNKDKQYLKFKNDKNVRVLIANPASGGEGLNLQEASVAIFYSNGYAGATVRQQAEGRIWRLGQTRPCLFIDLLMKDSIDEHKMGVLKDRADMAAGILKYIREWKSK